MISIFYLFSAFGLCFVCRKNTHGMNTTESNWVGGIWSGLCQTLLESEILIRKLMFLFFSFWNEFCIIIQNTKDNFGLGTEIEFPSKNYLQSVCILCKDFDLHFKLFWCNFSTSLPAPFNNFVLSCIKVKDTFSKFKLQKKFQFRFPWIYPHFGT